MKCLIPALTALALVAPDSARETHAAPAFDPRAWRGTQAGAPTEVLTLGSPHLSGIPAAADSSLMDALIDKLAVYKPDIITVENVSGEQCDHLRLYAGTYPESFDTWCKSPEIAQKAIGFDLPTAAAEVHQTLAHWPAEPTPADRRHLAALFLAAGETPSAVVQWLRLPTTERHPGDGLTDQTVKLLERKGAKPDETYAIAVALAVRLGLERINTIDDHTSDGVLIDTDETYDKAIQAAWKIAPSKAIPKAQAMEAALKTSNDVLVLYRFLNDPGNAGQNIEADFHATMSQATPQQYGRLYVAGWEVRNLRMVANIRAAFGPHPGARVLNIVGASHKPYFDAYLDMMPDVELIDAESVLR